MQRAVRKILCSRVQASLVSISPLDGQHALLSGIIQCAGQMPSPVPQSCGWQNHRESFKCVTHLAQHLRWRLNAEVRRDAVSWLALCNDFGLNAFCRTCACADGCFLVTCTGAPALTREFQHPPAIPTRSLQCGLWAVPPDMCWRCAA